MSYVLTKFIMVMLPCAAGALPCLIWIRCCALVSIQAVRLHFVGVRLFQYSSLRFVEQLSRISRDRCFANILRDAF